MSFDANACGAPLLALIPGWTDAHVRAFLAERETAPYQDLADLKTRLASKAPVDALEPL
jgi:predicted nucleic acid-binding OB-fold protein